MPASETTWLSARSHRRSIHASRRDSTPLLNLGEQPQAPTTRPFELQTTLVENPADKENCAPGSGVAVTQATELPNGSKRKRGSQSVDMEQAEDQLLHPAKKSKQETRQGSKTRASATRSSPAAAPSPKTPTGDAIVRASNRTVDHGAGQSSAAPEVLRSPRIGPRGHHPSVAGGNAKRTRRSGPAEGSRARHRSLDCCQSEGKNHDPTKRLRSGPRPEARRTPRALTAVGYRRSQRRPKAQSLGQFPSLL